MPATSSRRVVGSLFAMDAAFKLLVTPAYINVAPLTTGAQLALVMLPATATWVVCMLALLAPIRAYHAAGEPAGAATSRAAARLRWLPELFALMWSANWCIPMGVLASITGSWSMPVALFLGAMLLGPLPLAFIMTERLISPTSHAVFLRARRLGVVVRPSTVTLRRRMVVFCLTIAVAPTLYMASIAASAHAMPSSNLAVLIVLFLAGVALFAVLCAALFADAMARPLAQMTDVASAIARQGDVARVGRLPYGHEDEIGTLAMWTNRMLDRLEQVEAERHGAAQSLATLNQTLEHRVADRTIALERRNADMRLVLDSVVEGLFVIGGTGAIVGEHSAPLARWLGAPHPGESCWDYFGRTAPELGERTRLAWGQVTDGFLPLEVALEQMPRHVRTGGRDLELSYRTVGADLSEGVFVVVEDVTSRVEREAAERDKREAFAAFKHIASNRDGFLGFLEEGAQQLSCTLALDTSPAERKRALHTLKGNSLLFGIESVAAICHDLESELAEHGAAAPASLAALRTRWDGLAVEVETWLGKRRLMIELEPEQLAALERAVVAATSPEAMLDMLHELRLEPARRRLDHFAEQARQIATRLDKDVEIEIVDEGVRVDPGWTQIWSAFIHVLRNAIGHGLEPPDERLAHGKPARGRLALRALRGPGVAMIEIEDDGRGIAWDRVRARADALGLSAATHDDLVDALFADGLSTAAQVSDLSGRGIGLGALRAAVRARGGAIEVTSTPGRGTRVRIVASVASLGRSAAA